MVKLLQSATGPALKHHHGVGMALNFSVDVLNSPDGNWPGLQIGG